MIVKLLLIILLTTDALASRTTAKTTKRTRKKLPAPNRTALLIDAELSNEEYNVNENNTKNTRNAYDRNKIRNYRGWTYSPVAMTVFNEWLDDYYEDKEQKTNIDYVDPDNVHEFDGERAPHSGFPRDWAGVLSSIVDRIWTEKLLLHEVDGHFLDMGAGQQGVAPPPWAYEPVRKLIPRRCYIFVHQGEFCEGQTNVQKRYAYNAFLNKCEEFRYKGCNGTQNNFQEKTDCEDTCIKTVSSSGGCDTNSHIRKEKKDLK